MSLQILKIRYRQFKTNHPILNFSIKSALIAGIAYLCISPYVHERKVDRVADQVGVLEKMIEAQNFNGARPLAQSLYDALHDETDPRMRILYDDFVFPCYKGLKEKEPTGYTGRKYKLE